MYIGKGDTASAKTFDITFISGYGNFTIDNFVVEITSIGMRSESYGSTTMESNSYNSTTGILTVGKKWKRLTLSNSSEIRGWAEYNVYVCY